MYLSSDDLILQEFIFIILIQNLVFELFKFKFGLLEVFKINYFLDFEDFKKIFS